MCQILGHFSFSFLSWIIEYNVLEGQLELVQSDKKMVVHGRRDSSSLDIWMSSLRAGSG